jgi:hypothetical protein
MPGRRAVRRHRPLHARQARRDPRRRARRRQRHDAGAARRVGGDELCARAAAGARLLHCFGGWTMLLRCRGGQPPPIHQTTRLILSSSKVHKHTHTQGPLIQSTPRRPRRRWRRSRPAWPSARRTPGCCLTRLSTLPRTCWRAPTRRAPAPRAWGGGEPRPGPGGRARAVCVRGTLLGGCLAQRRSRRLCLGGSGAGPPWGGVRTPAAAAHGRSHALAPSGRPRIAAVPPTHLQFLLHACNARAARAPRCALRAPPACCGQHVEPPLRSRAPSRRHPHALARTGARTRHANLSSFACPRYHLSLFRGGAGAPA